MFRIGDVELAEQYSRLKRVFSNESAVTYVYEQNNPKTAKLGNYDEPFSLEDGTSLRFDLKPSEPEPEFESLEWTPGVRGKSCFAFIEQHTRSHVQFFQAERQINPKMSSNPDSRMKHDASNVAQVLLTLDGLERYVREEYSLLLMRVFPEIKEFRTPIANGNVNIVVGFLELVERRPDLARSILDCGTGFFHVMAMLYALVCRQESQVIIVDEPYSFLHPSAIRELLKIFQEFPDHQYILTTHSPTAIMSVQNKRILLVKRENMVSSVKSVNVKANKELENALNEIGSKRSDIFGMDAVIWVEGKTDEICFKMIMEHNGGLPFGTNIQSLVNTGDIEDKKHAKLAVAIYQNLSGGVGLLPSVLAFVFDGDKDGGHADTEEIYPDLIKYLPRQTYENYLIEFPAIIAEVLNEKHGDRTQEYTEAQVEQWIAGNKVKDKYCADGIIYDELTWLSDVNGAKFIKNMFWEMSKKGCTYNKVKFGEEITNRILAKSPNHFQEIVDLINSVLPEGNLFNSA